MNRFTGIRLAASAVGSTAVLLGFRQGGWGRVLSVAAGTGLIAYAALTKHSQREPSERASPKSLAITSVLTIGKSREELYRKLRDPRTLSAVAGDAVVVSSEGQERIRVRVTLPGKHEVTWTSRLAEQGQGSSFLWQTESGATFPHQVSVRLRDARPSEWGTVVTLSISPLSDSTLAQAFVRLTRSLDQAMLTKILRRFKSLVETGEMPTLSQNPAARHRAIAAA